VAMYTTKAGIQMFCLKDDIGQYRKWIWLLPSWQSKAIIRSVYIYCHKPDLVITDFHCSIFWNGALTQQDGLCLFT